MVKATRSRNAVVAPAADASATDRRTGLSVGVVAVSVVLLGCLAYAEWPALRTMASRWWSDPRYTHGVLVAPFAVYLAWRRGLELGPVSWTAGLASVALFVLGAAMKLGGALIYLAWLDAASLMPWLAGLSLILGGWRLLGRVWPAILFLVFMIPLPFRVETAVGGPMQRLATVASTYLLQTFGLEASAEGNIIALGDTRTIAVVEACNGLGMLFTFACYATGFAILSTKPIVDRLLILVSAVPLALIANVLRITVTGLAHQFLGGGAADAFFHDLAGWLMMPVALAMLAGVAWFLSAIWIESPVSKSSRPGQGPGLAGLAGIEISTSRRASINRG